MECRSILYYRKQQSHLEAFFHICYRCSIAFCDLFSFWFYHRRICEHLGAYTNFERCLVTNLFSSPYYVRSHLLNKWLWKDDSDIRDVIVFRKPICLSSSNITISAGSTVSLNVCDHMKYDHFRPRSGGLPKD